MDHVPASLDDVLITAELWRRPTRPPDYAAEGRALTALAEAMADSPQTILRKLVETALTLCRADSAGISILEPKGAAGVFRWHAIAGQFASNMGGEMPREASPSGTVLDRDVSLLFSYPERHFDYGMTISPPIVEALLVPFHSEGKPVGTLWLISHTPNRKINREDQRVLSSLSHFASTAYQVRMEALTAVRAKEDVRQILDTAAIGLTRCSRDLRYVACNRAYETLVGLSAEQIIGRPITDVIGTKAFEVKRPYIERVLRGERVEYEEEVPFAASGNRFLHVVYEAWFDCEGQVSGWIASVSDITDLKRTTKALRDSEEREAFLLRLSDTIRPLSDPLAIQEVTARLVGEHLHVNRVGYADIEGTDFITRLDYANGVAPFQCRGPVAIFGESLLETYRRGEPVAVNDVCSDPRLTESERAVLLTNDIAAFAGEMLLKNKQWVAVFGVQNATPRAWTKPEVELLRDVAERVWEAVERARAEAALREREQRLRLALDASGAGSWMRDARTGHIDWDGRFRKLYGFTAEEPASLEAWLSRIHEEDRQQVVELVEQIRHTKTHDTFDSTFRIVRPDGTVSWIQSVGQAHRDADGQLMWLTGLELDVTERRRAEEALQARRAEERDRILQKQAEEALRRSHSELEQRTLQLSRLASQLTLAEQTVRKQLASTLHDGLQQLLFSAGITLDQAVKPGSQDDQAALLQKARAVVNEAIETTRTMTVNLFPPVLHVGGLPAALSWLAKRTQEQYNVIVNVTADSQANPETTEVRILLFEAVRELLFNAVKHARVDRVDVNLVLGPDDTIDIQVSDDGAGFDPSATLYDRNHPQAGLGLFSIQERFALLGGHLDIESAPGQGSRFTLTLARTGLTRLATDGRETPRRVTDRQQRPVYNPAGGTSKSLRILIADDHAVVRAGLGELLSERPELRVVGEAANGVEAISQAKTLQPDVILMDVAMPQKNGIEATQEIHGMLPHIQIVGLSSFCDETTERAMREAGAQAYFSKTESTHQLFDYMLSLRPQAKTASGT